MGKNKFTVLVTMDGYDPNRDDRLLENISEASKKFYDGSGFSFPDHKRDLFFYTPDTETSNLVADEVKTVAAAQGIPVEVKINVHDVTT
jgi:hypothetical protein